MSKIQLIDICKNYNSTAALKNVNITFETKKIYGLLGRNGAGKSTMLNIISNRILPTSGKVMIDECNLHQITHQINGIYLAGESNLYPESMRVHEIFNWTKEFFPSFDMDLALQLTEQFRLNTHKRVKSLSTGYTTILKDIIGLCVNTDFVFFDEPVLGLDANHRDLFYKHLLNCYMNNASTFVVSTHLINEVANIIENVIIIDDGKILRDTTCEKLLSEGYTVTGNINVVDEYTKELNVIGSDTLGNTKAAYVLAENKLAKTNGIEIENINLQKLFVKLTKKEAE